MLILNYKKYCLLYINASCSVRIHWRIAEEWHKEILASVCLYGALVDANMLCFLWPRELNPYRICFISGSLTKPLISCFEPPPSVLLGNTSCENPADSLTEVIIRCSGDHFTLLRPVNALSGGGGNSPKGFQVRDCLFARCDVIICLLQIRFWDSCVNSGQLFWWHCSPGFHRVVMVVCCWNLHDFIWCYPFIGHIAAIAWRARGKTRDTGEFSPGTRERALH